mmetsp:Transcript_58220/g.167007  ORF Transcript_58220/g.167007 Transcript_58220/m.167007 type:complete len:210 (+) Transcript_58220:2317-2946(+)
MRSAERVRSCIGRATRGAWSPPGHTASKMAWICSTAFPQASGDPHNLTELSTIWTMAPEFACTPRMVAPPLPMMCATAPSATGRFWTVVWRWISATAASTASDGPLTSTIVCSPWPLVQTAAPLLASRSRQPAPCWPARCTAAYQGNVTWRQRCPSSCRSNAPAASTSERLPASSAAAGPPLRAWSMRSCAPDAAWMSRRIAPPLAIKH